jgi:hypothetical protein
MTQVWDVQDDPMAAAMEAEAAADAMDRQWQTVYGLIEFDIWFCALVKGAGKVPYDPELHKDLKRFVAVNVAIQPVASHGAMRFPIERSFIAEFRKDGWLAVTLPSIQALGIEKHELREKLNGKYVKVEMVKTGERFTGNDGTEKEKTAPRILAVYQSEEEALNAAQSELTQPHATAVDDIPTGLPTNGHSANGGSDAERATALSFLPAFLSQCRNGDAMDMGKVREVIKSQPLLAKYFTETSPEVIEATRAVLTEPAF